MYEFLISREEIAEKIQKGESVLMRKFIIGILTAFLVFAFVGGALAAPTTTKYLSYADNACDMSAISLGGSAQTIGNWIKNFHSKSVMDSEFVTKAAFSTAVGDVDIYAMWGFSDMTAATPAFTQLEFTVDPADDTVFNTLPDGLKLVIVGGTSADTDMTKLGEAASITRTGKTVSATLASPCTLCDFSGGAGENFLLLVKGSTPIGTKPTIKTDAAQAVVAGKEYLLSLATDGDTPITWTKSGDLPAGLAMSGYVISGKATTVGSYPVTFIATNAAGGVFPVRLTATTLCGDRCL